MITPLLHAIPADMVRFFARPYVAGDSLGQAMDTAAEVLRARGCVTTLDLLAEGIDSEAAVEHNLFAYLEMVNAAAGDDRFGPDQRPTVSLKPSSFTTEPLSTGGAARGSRETVRRICEHARELRVPVTIDMESHHWTDFTLELVSDLHADGFSDVGTVIQTRLQRSEADLDRLPEGCRVRLVIGIYPESADIAVTDKRPMKERLLEYGQTLLARGHYVELATHDEEIVNRFVDTAPPADRFEVQMLYGVPRHELQSKLVDGGVRLRLYVPFALGWDEAIAYLRRRLDEYPAMMYHVARRRRLGAQPCMTRPR